MFGPVILFKLQNLFSDIKMLGRSLVLIALSIIDIGASLLFFWRINGGFVLRFAHARTALGMEAVEDLDERSKQVSALDEKFQEKLRSMQP